MVKISNRICIQALCVLGILALSGSALFAAEPVKLGAAVSLTGNLAKLGAETKAGYELWMEKVNAQGGLNVKGEKRPVAITFYDDQSDANRATKLVDKLISEDGIKLILGPYSSGITLPVSTITERNRVLLMSAGGNADELFTRNFRYIFGVWPLASEPIQTTLKVIKAADPSLKNVGIAVKDNLFSLTAARGAREEAKNQDYNIVLDEKYPADVNDFSSLIGKAKGIENRYHGRTRSRQGGHSFCQAVEGAWILAQGLDLATGAGNGRFQEFARLSRQLRLLVRAVVACRPL